MAIKKTPIGDNDYTKHKNIKAQKLLEPDFSNSKPKKRKLLHWPFKRKKKISKSKSEGQSVKRKTRTLKISSSEPKLNIVELETSTSSRFKRFKEKEFQYVSEDEIDNDFLSTADLMDAVGIAVNEKGHPIKIDNKYSRYMQIMEVDGQDLGSLSDEEQDRVVDNFTNFLVRYPYSLTFESTTLPTNTNSQYGESNRIYREIVAQLSNPNIPVRIYKQLQDRLRLLQNNMNLEELVAQQLYNAEFLIIIHGDSPSELDKYVRACYSAGSSGFKPRIVSDAKKKQIIKQYNNQNERV